MQKNKKVIITCALTGAVHTPSMSPYLPVTADEIAEAAIGAVEAGAAIVHLHARDPKTGKPDQSPDAYRPILKTIKARSGCVVNITTGGAPTMTLEERLRPVAEFKPEVAAHSAVLGGNVRVGIEDSLWAGPGKLAESNAQQVSAVRQIIENLGLDIATSDEAREILQLKGSSQVAF
jgi:uncharacterized protein (DUF849 family)